MLRRTLLGIALTALLAPLAHAQTVDEIVAKYVQARGGLDKLKAVQSVRMTGRMTMGPGMEAPVMLEMVRPNKMRMEFTVQGMTGVQAYDGSTAWILMPFMGKKNPEAVPAEDAKRFEEQADMDGPLVDYKQKGNQVELMGKEPVEGTDAYKLKLTLKNGSVRYLYIDAENFLEIRTESKRTVQGTEVEMVGTPGDYKKVDGVMYPFSLESGMKGGQQTNKMTIDSIAVNLTIDPTQFAMPAVAHADSDNVSKTAAAGTGEMKKSQMEQGPARGSSTPDATKPAATRKATKKKSKAATAVKP